MILKIIGALGWICFALDAAFVVMLFVSKNAGNDAAGQGVARGWSLVILPILLAAGGWLYWGMRSGSTVGTIAGTLLLAIPFMFMANSKISRMRESANYYAVKARDGNFADAKLNEIVKAIDAADTTGLRALLAANKSLNLAQRDAAGHTLLGFAVTRANDYFDATPDKKVSLQMLFAAGVPYAPDALEADGDWNRDLLASGGNRNLDIIEMAFAAGANPRAQMKIDKEDVILNSNISLPKAELLVKHGADVHALTRLGHNTVMNAIRFKMFPEALYYLEQGVDANYVAPDGKTAQSELDRVVAQNASYQTPMETGYPEFAAALAARIKKP